MDTKPFTVIPPVAPTADTPLLRKVWRGIRARMLGGLVLLLPILITFWVIFWSGSMLVRHVIDPLAQLVLWKVRGRQPDADLPVWFEVYAAPAIAIVVALVVLYCLGFFVHTRLRGAVDAIMLRVPVVSTVYNGVRQVLQTLDQQQGQPRPQRVVLVAFPQPGMRAPAFVTATCRDTVTQKPLLCVYVPTTPVPTSGYFLLVPEDEVVELDWTPEQALQTIISGGLTAPPEVNYYRAKPNDA